MLSGILDWIAGLLWIWGIQKLWFLTSFKIIPSFPITKPGLLASIITMLLWGSNKIFVTSASSGTVSLIIFSVSSSSFNNLGSALNSILFLNFPTSSLIFPPLSLNNWKQLFSLYQQIPEYKLVNSSMTLEQFKVIYWW